MLKAPYLAFGDGFLVAGQGIFAAPWSAASCHLQRHRLIMCPAVVVLTTHFLQQCDETARVATHRSYLISFVIVRCFAPPDTAWFAQEGRSRWIYIYNRLEIHTTVCAKTAQARFQPVDTYRSFRLEYCGVPVQCLGQKTTAVRGARVHSGVYQTPGTDSRPRKSCGAIIM